MSGTDHSDRLGGQHGPRHAGDTRGSRSQPRSRSDLEVLPKAELHVHLRGAAPMDYLQRQLRKYPVAQALRSSPPDQVAWMLAHPNVRRVVDAADPAGALAGLFHYQSFEQFLAAYLFTGGLVRTLEDFRELVHAVCAELCRRNVVYAELTVSLPEYVQQGMEVGDLLGVLGEERCEPPTVRWIVDPVRNLGTAAAASLVEEVLARRPSSVVGITLGGAEHLFPAAPFRRVYEIARDGGLRTTVHAGEALGPESVWDAVRILRVERVGHGVRAIEDERLVRHLAERRIPLEVCPTSNVRTGVYGSLDEHPVRRLHEAGVPLTVNTDDPTFFGVSLSGELARLRRLDFSWSEIADLARNAFRFAFDPAAAQRCQ